MNIDSAFTSAVSGLQRSRTNLQQNAQDIASVATPAGKDVNLNESLIDLKINQRFFEANAKVLGTADDTVGTILDVIA
jgi:flagellar hook protein FlgE